MTKCRLLLRPCHPPIARVVVVRRPIRAPPEAEAVGIQRQGDVAVRIAGTRGSGYLRQRICLHGDGALRAGDR